MKRKVIQLLKWGSDDLLTLCDDGSIWLRGFETIPPYKVLWTPIDGPPEEIK